jgi:hypothetical protein
VCVWGHRTQMPEMSSSTASRAPGSADELVPGTISANQVLLGTVKSRRRPHQHRQCSAKAAWHLTVPTTLPSAPRVPLATNLPLPLRSRALEVPGSSPRAPPVPKSSPSAPRVPIATSPALSGTRSARQLAARTSSAHRSSTGSVGRGFQEATTRILVSLKLAFTEPSQNHKEGTGAKLRAEPR